MTGDPGVVGSALAGAWGGVAATQLACAAASAACPMATQWTAAAIGAALLAASAIRRRTRDARIAKPLPADGNAR